MDRKTYLIDGHRFSTLDEFFAEISRVLIPDEVPCKFLDGFNDILHGQYGNLEREFILIWANSNVSRAMLGFEAIATLQKEGFDNITQSLAYPELLQREFERIKNSFPEYDEVFWLKELASFEAAYTGMQHRFTLAQQYKGTTLFELLVAIIKEHPNVELRLLN